jgi:hypothetical protein
MSAQVTITQLPAAGAITGTESVPIVQNGQTVRTTTGAIAASPSQTQTFITVNQETSLPNSRSLGATNGLTLSDGGAQGVMNISTTGALLSLTTSGTGLQVKTNSTTLTGRTIASGSTGLSVSNGDGIAGNPTVALTGQILNFANASANGILTLTTGGTVSSTSILGTSNQIDVSNGTGISGSPTISIASDPILPGTGAVTLPQGTTAQQPGGSQGQFRFNTQTQTFDGYSSGAWRTFTTSGGVTTFSGGTTGLLPSSAQAGAIVLSGTLIPANGGTGATSLTGYLVGNGSSAFTAVSTIPNAGLTNSSITINGSTVSLGGTVTVTATSTGTLSIGTGLSGTSYNGSANVTIAIDSTVATLTGTQTLTNKTINGSSNTISNISNASLSNSAITLGSTAVSLGATSTTLAGLASVTVTADPTLDFQLTTKQYVDGLVATGLTYHQPVQVATTTTLAATTGGTVTYNNGAAGVGATLTLSVALTVLDGYTLLNTDRILVKNEANAAYNGIYTWATGGTVLTRATDANTYGPGTNQLSLNDYFFVQNGTVNKGTSFVLTTTGTITFGTTLLTFAEFSSSQVYTGTAPINVSGTVISLSTVPVGSGGTNITSYTIGDMLYASATGTLAKLALGTGGYVLTAGGAAPQYVAQSTLSVGSATTATTATTSTNIAGGTAGSVPYNTAAGTTTFLGLGTTNYVLTAGAAAPQYVAQSTLSVGSATTATNLAGGANGSVPYQTGSGATTFLAAGTNGYVLTLASGVPTWANPASTGVSTFSGGTTGLTPSTATSGAITLAGTLAIANGGTNSTATPTAGGAGYGTGTAHAYTAAGTAGYVLLSNGVSAPTWSGVSGGTF